MIEITDEVGYFNVKAQSFLQISLSPTSLAANGHVGLSVCHLSTPLRGCSHPFLGPWQFAGRFYSLHILGASSAHAWPESVVSKLVPVCNTLLVSRILFNGNDTGCSFYGGKQNVQRGEH